MRLPDTIFIGNSHVECLRAAIQIRDDAKPFVLKPFSDPTKDRATIRWDGLKHVFDKDYISELTDLLSSDGPQTIVACVTSTKHYELGMFNLVVPIDFFEPGSVHEKPADPMSLVPHSMIVEFFKDQHSQLFDIFNLLPQSAFRRVLVPSTPPVSDDDTLMNLRAPPIWRENIEKYGVPRRALRKRLWSASCKALELLCGERGFEFLPSPSESMKNGFARADMLSDGFHGSVTYGKLVLSQIWGME